MNPPTLTTIPTFGMMSETACVLSGFVYVGTRVVLPYRTAVLRFSDAVMNADEYYSPPPSVDFCFFVCSLRYHTFPHLVHLVGGMILFTWHASPCPAPVGRNHPVGGPKDVGNYSTTAVSYSYLMFVLFEREKHLCHAVR